MKHIFNQVSLLYNICQYTTLYTSTFVSFTLYLGGKMCVLHLYHGGVLVYRGASNRCDIHNPCIPLPNGGPDVRERNKYPICKRKCVKMYIVFLNELKTAYFIPRIELFLSSIFSRNIGLVAQIRTCPS